jgi:hypothetical protein
MISGFNLSLKVSFGESYVSWVDNAHIKHDEEKRILSFKYPLVITMPKYHWENAVDYLLFEFYRDRSIFLMPSTRWGYAVIEAPQIHESDFIDDDEDDDEANNTVRSNTSNNNKSNNKNNNKTTTNTEKMKALLKKHQLGSDEEGLTEGQVRKDGFVSNVDEDEEVSTLPTDDWIRCVCVCVYLYVCLLNM